MASFPDVLSLLDVPGLEALADVCKRFEVQFTAHGSLPRRLIMLAADSKRSSGDLFNLVPFMSDIDLVHTGATEMTPRIAEAIYEIIPFAECFRWEIKSVEEQSPYHQATLTNAIVPVFFMTLSTNQASGVQDPWNARDDITNGRYRYIRNGFYRRSPLYQTGHDLEFFSTLLYLRTLLEANVDVQALDNQPGWGDSQSVIRDAKHIETLMALQESAYLRSRLRYLLKVLCTSGPLHSALLLMEVSGLEQLLKYIDEGLGLGTSTSMASYAMFGREDDKKVVVGSARLGGDIFRLQHFTDAWKTGESASEAWKQALHNKPIESIRDAGRLSDRVLDPAQEILLASPTISIHPGKSASSYQTEMYPMEFIHFGLLVNNAQNIVGQRSEEDITTLLVFSAVKDDQKYTSVLALPTVCTLPNTASEQSTDERLLVRVNAGGVGGRSWHCGPS